MVSIHSVDQGERKCAEQDTAEWRLYRRVRLGKLYDGSESAPDLVEKAIA